jgi:diguanylate cyclase
VPKTEHDLRYHESSGLSAELMRMVLPQMAKHGGVYHPTNYALWYEYFAGVNPRLQAALSERLERPQPLAPHEAEQLYTRYLVAREVEQAERLQEAFQSVVEKLRGVAAAAGKDASEYGQQLDQAARSLADGLDAGQLAQLVGLLIQQTSKAQTSAAGMSAQIDAGIQEVSELKKQLGQVQNEAVTDPLTGLRNRRGFDRSVTSLLASRPQGLVGCAVLMGDIDHFKRVNDTYGHLLGDQVIKGVAQIILRTVKGNDLAARYGGEEFAVLLPDTPLRGAITVAEQIRHGVASTRICKTGTNVYVDQITLSMGAAIGTASDTIESLIERADKALYHAKQTGRNRVESAAAAA